MVTEQEIKNRVFTVDFEGSEHKLYFRRAPEYKGYRQKGQYNYRKYSVSMQESQSSKTHYLPEAVYRD